MRVIPDIWDILTLAHVLSGMAGIISERGKVQLKVCEEEKTHRKIRLVEKISKSNGLKICLNYVPNWD